MMNMTPQSQRKKEARRKRRRRRKKKRKYFVISSNVERISLDSSPSHRERGFYNHTEDQQ
jgi:hypothetical protein